MNNTEHGVGNNYPLKGYKHFRRRKAEDWCKRASSSIEGQAVKCELEDLYKLVEVMSKHRHLLPEEIKVELDLYYSNANIFKEIWED